MTDRGKPEYSSALDVQHIVATDYRILPVGNEHRAVGSHSDVARPEHRIRTDDGVLWFHGISRSLRTDEEGLDQPLARLRVQELIPVPFWKQVAFVDHQTRGRSGAGPGNVGNRAWTLLVKVRTPVLAPPGPQ